MSKQSIKNLPGSNNNFAAALIYFYLLPDTKFSETIQ